jgi:hypothetical protein
MERDVHLHAFHVVREDLGLGVGRLGFRRRLLHSAPLLSRGIRSGRDHGHAGRHHERRAEQSDSRPRCFGHGFSFSDHAFA